MTTPTNAPVTPDVATAQVANQGDDLVSVIDLVTRTVTVTIVWE